MRKHVLLAVFVMIFGISFSQNQPQNTSDPWNYKNIFKVSVAKFTRNTFQMGIEHYFQPNTSFLFCAGLNYKDDDYNQYWGVNAEAQLKFHVFQNQKTHARHSLYFAPYLVNTYEQHEWRAYDYSAPTTRSEDFDALGAGILFGWSFTFANRVNLDIYTGGGLQKAFNVENDYLGDIFDYGYSGIVPRLGIDIGFWF